MAVHFTMLTPDARTIECSISNSAIAIVYGKKWKSPQQPNVAFDLRRDRIEKIASDMYDQNNSDHIRIFAKHVDPAARTR
jgi:Protein of unknown function (DUF1488)